MIAFIIMIRTGGAHQGGAQTKGTFRYLNRGGGDRGTGEENRGNRGVGKEGKRGTRGKQGKNKIENGGEKDKIKQKRPANGSPNLH